MHTDQFHRVIRLGSAGLLAATLATGPAALAQFAPGMTGMGGVPNPKSIPGNLPQATQPQQAPPPALPGSKPNAAAAAPANQPAADMLPTDALFDAINRGDIAAARDAISRGADLNGRNVLGMTPMELSVDLGRNDISFLLLSMRPEDHGRSATAQAGQTMEAPKPTVKVARRQAIVPAKADAPPAQRTPRLFANDGGAPVPSVGFLGFDPVRTR